RRGIAWQTLQAHGLAYDSENARWLVPFRGGEGSVVNLMLYDPDARVAARMLPGLPAALFNFDKLMSTSANVPVMLCDGPFNAVACDYAIGAHTRPKYAVVGVPGAFKPAWAEHFRGRRVRALMDNDERGERHNRRLQKVLGGVAAELLLLRWPEG